MADNWDRFAAYFDDLGEQFDERFARHYTTVSTHAATSATVVVQPSKVVQASGDAA